MTTISNNSFSFYIILYKWWFPVKKLLNNRKIGWDRHASHYLDVLYRSDERMTTTSTRSFFSSYSIFLLLFFLFVVLIIIIIINHLWTLAMRTIDSISSSSPTAISFFSSSLSLFILLHLLQDLLTLEIDDDLIYLCSIKKNSAL